MELENNFIAIAFGLILSAFTCGIAAYSGFFHFENPPSSKLHLGHVLGVFVLFLSVPIWLAPLTAYVIVSITSGAFSHQLASIIKVMKHPWFQLGVILTSVLVVGIYTYKLRRLFIPLFGPEGTNWKWSMKQFGMGLLTCLICFPVVMTVSLIIQTILYLAFQILPIEQVAVVHLRSLLDKPFLFGLTTLAVVTVVPMVEEVIFRGFFQTWLMSKIGVGKAIVLTALLFALFHYSQQQEVYNFQIVGSLFVLALFLGFIYVRQQSLWAPIALHMLFNFIGVSAIFLDGNG